MTTKPKVATQVQRFKAAARELGCDESEERFDAALKMVAKHRPKDELKAGKTRRAVVAAATVKKPKKP